MSVYIQYLVLLLPDDGPSWGRICLPFNKHIYKRLLVVIGDFYIFVTDRATGTFHTKFPKLSCQNVSCRYLPAWRYIAGGSLVRISSLLAFRISSTACD
jgi:hypothetical protein